MHLKRLAVFAFVALALFALWWRGRSEDRVFERQKLSGIAADVDGSRLHKVRLENLARDTAMTFERDANGFWLITDPLAWKAEDGVLRQLLDGLRSLPAEPAPEVEPERVELSPEHARVELHERIAGAPERVTTIKIGAIDLDGERCFAERDGKVYRITRGVREQLELDVAFYRAKRLIEFLPQEVVAVKRSGRLASPDWQGPPPSAQTARPPAPGEPVDPADLTLELSASPGGWAIERPFEARGDPNLIQANLLILSQARATQFPDDEPQDLTPYGLDRPWMTISLSLSGGRVETLEIASSKPLPEGLTPGELRDRLEEDNWYARRAGLPNVFRVEASLLRTVTQPALEFCDQNLFRARLEDVKRFDCRLTGALAVEAGQLEGGGLALRQRAPSFDVAAPTPVGVEPAWTLADRGLAQDYLAPLLGLSSAAVMDPAIAPQTEASGSLVLLRTDGDLQELELGGAAELAGVQGQWIRRLGETPWQFVSLDVAKTLGKGPADLLAKSPLLLKELDLARVELSDGSRQRVWDRDPRTALWNPAGLGVEDKRFARSVDALLAPRAERWELQAGAPDLEQRTLDPRLTVRLVPASQGSPEQYRLARDSAGQVWLEFQGRCGPAVVEAFQGALELLDGE